MSREMRGCRACEGSRLAVGCTPEWGPCLRGDGPHDCRCPVCLGTGKVEAKPSVRDAIADAETLRWALATADVVDLNPLGWPGSLVGATVTAAHVAFRAVPALRGDR